MRRILIAVLAISVVLTTAGSASADADHDAKQDRQVLNARTPKGHDLLGGSKARKSWGADGNEATGYALTLVMPLPPHAVINTFELHVRWTVRHHTITNYSVWPSEGPGFPFTHWEYRGISAHVVNVYRRRAYARFTADYRLCIAWLIPVCTDKHPTIHITVYGANRAPDEGGSWS